MSHTANIEYEEMRGKDLQPGELFSSEGASYWDHRDPSSIGEKVYIRTEGYLPPAEGETIVWRITTATTLSPANKAKLEAVLEAVKHLLADFGPFYRSRLPHSSEGTYLSPAARSIDTELIEILKAAYEEAAK